MKSGTSESLLLAFAAASAATLNVLYQRHVQIVLDDPSTYTSVFHHKCGIAMVVCLMWASFEGIVYAAAMMRESRDDRRRLARQQALNSRRASFPYAAAK